MFLSFLEGLLLGLPFVIVIGPAFFAILQTSMNKGFYSGMQLAIGIALSDSLLMFGCYFGLMRFFANDTFQIIIGFLGTVVLLLYGIYLFHRTKLPQAKDDIEIPLPLKIKWGDVFTQIGKGFFLNIMNPFLWMMWLAIVVSATSNRTTANAVIFLIGIEIMIFSTDTLKSYFANKISHLLSPKLIFYSNKVVGGLLMSFSVILCVRTIGHFIFHLF